MPCYLARATASAALLSVTLSVCMTRESEAQVTRNATLLSHLNLYSSYTNSWPYIHSDGREYVVIGTRNGTSIVRLTDPSNPVEVAFIPGVTCTTRDVDQYQNYIYSMGGFCGTQGIQIISMADPDNPVLVKTVHGVVETAENITIDVSRALLFTSVSDTDRGLRIVSLADPLNPVLLHSNPAYEVHDFTFRGTIGYAASLLGEALHVLDTSNPAAPVEITSFPTQGATHSAWPSDDGRYLYVSNEDFGGGELVVYDAQDMAQPVEVYRADLAGLSTLHYTRVLGSRLFVSHYSAGARFLDLSNPAWPVEAGYVDTYLGDDLIVTGAYDTSPYYPSGIVTASDRASGLYVFRSGSNHGLVRGTVTADAGHTTGPLAGATVRVLPNGPSTTTGADGRYGLAPEPGTVQIEVSKFGYASSTATVSVTLGGDQTVNFATTQSLTGTIKGTVVQASDQSMLRYAEVTVPGTPLLSVTSGRGTYSLMRAPAGSTVVRADRPGYVPVQGIANVVGRRTSIVDFALPTADFYDDMETDQGWTVGGPGDDATAGQWVRAVPIGSSTLSGVQAQPDEDHTPGPGTQCFVTANGAEGGSANAADVDGGKTTLTSPILSLGSVADPRIVFWRWLYSGSRGPGASPFLTELSNDAGATWTAVDSAQAARTWERVELRVTDYFPSPGNVRVRIIAQDRFSGNLTVEAAVDDFEYYSGAAMGTFLPSADAPAEALETRAGFSIKQIGGSREGMTFQLRSDQERSGAVARLFDVNGRLVRTLLHGKLPSGTSRIAWDGKTAHGVTASAGVYLLRLTAGDTSTQLKVVLVH